MTDARFSPVRHSARAAVGSFNASMQVAAQYRANFIIWLVTGMLGIIVYMSVWRAVAEARGGAAYGFSAEQFAGYFLCLMVVREMTFTWIRYDFATHVRTGSLSPRLLRPTHPLVESWGWMLAGRAQNTLMVIPAALVLAIVFNAEVEWRVTNLIGFAFVIPAAMATRYLVDCIFALFAFWLVNTQALNNLAFIAMLLFGGQIAPLDALPDWLASTAKVLPWWWCMGYPTELLMGRRDASSVPVALLVLAAWSIAAWLVVRIMWRRGVRAYGAVGA